ncbi:amidase family protein [endosymbiont GvMRE of Glomus versiforme]|uniref:amidase family protein n=1 Tax=endosymbiont GvMRE of Glomus versiforme TaxID=2039283 RepID=UPI000EDB1D72|nr:amidase family protein [endosymbiont GvMRE of Glomus versiforme]RHZ35324.1 Glutamyl-tRNA(Gln) amidotransferase subunit A [endosymbiont GvMRE of Glomus versiforme]
MKKLNIKLSDEKKKDCGIISCKSFDFNYENNWLYFVKDNFWTKDFSTTASSHFLTNFQSSQDASVIKYLNKNGFVLLGKTILDEFACGGTGLWANTGPIFNPYNSSHVSGGSSSGSAVVVAKRIVSFALGSDTGGSIRHPASYCGIIGFKPSYGLISRYGLIPTSSSLDTIGILANSITTAKKIFLTIARSDPNDLLTVVNSKKKIKKFLKLVRKIAILKGIEKCLCISFLKLYKKTLSLIEKRGYQIEVVEIPYNIRKNIQITWLIICFSELVSHLNSLQGITYGIKKNNVNAIKKRSKYLGKIVKQRLIIGAYFLESKELLEQAYYWQKKTQKWCEKIFCKYDFLVFPTTNNEAPKTSENSLFSLGSKMHWSENLLLLANLVGLPSLSLPIGFVNGLPVSININSIWGSDEKVLKLAKELETKIKFRKFFTENW